MSLTEHYAVGDPVNIGHDQEITIRQLVGVILRITGKSPKVVFDATKPDGYPRRAADVAKLRMVTGGFVPETPLEEGITEMVDQFRASTHEG